MKQFAIRKDLALYNTHDVDICLEKYAEQLHLGGESINLAKNALYGYAWRYSYPTRGPDNFPRIKSALKGWCKREPGASRDPVPWEVAAMMCRRFLATDHLEAALYCMIAFETYGRPNEIMKLALQHVAQPMAGYPKWALVFGPRELGVPTKTDTIDDGVTLATKGREWIQKLLWWLVRRAQARAQDLTKQWTPKKTHSKLFFCTLPEIEKAFRLCCNALDLQCLHITPHCMRHSGPSHDSAKELRTLKEICKRGRWKVLSSCNRYEKHSRIQRQFAKLDSHR